MKKCRAMKDYLGITAILAVILLFSSCFKEDTPVQLPPHGESQVTQIALGSSYTNQVYFQFKSGKTFTNDYRKWDLAFESSESGYHIWLNGGNMELATFLGSSVVIEDVTSVTGAAWKWDAPSWNRDSTAIGEWIDFYTMSDSATGVYAIDRGRTDILSADKMWKIQFVSVDEHSYTIRYGRLKKDAHIYTKTIDKDPARNYVLFSFDEEGKVVEQNPEKSEWDILFTRYRYIFYDNLPPGYFPPFLYPVEGVLINPENTSVAIDSVKTFSEIDYAYVKNLNYKTNRDMIGFEWKSINLSAPLLHYNVKSYLTYILKDQHGYYWKLRFLDFYNAQGEKGYPKLEYQQL